MIAPGNRAKAEAAEAEPSLTERLASRGCTAGGECHQTQGKQAHKYRLPLGTR